MNSLEEFDGKWSDNLKNLPHMYIYIYWLIALCKKRNEHQLILFFPLFYLEIINCKFWFSMILQFNHFNRENKENFDFRLKNFIFLFCEFFLYNFIFFCYKSNRGKTNTTKGWLKRERMIFFTKKYLQLTIYIFLIFICFAFLYKGYKNMKSFLHKIKV